MTARPLAVRPWLHGCPAPDPGGELQVFSLTTPPGAIRDTARQQVRQVLREILAPRLACSPAAVPLVWQPGRALRLDMSGQPFGLSVSHEPGLSLIAIRAGGAVGIDLLDVHRAELADDELQRLAVDYFGEIAARRIVAQPRPRRRLAFATAWVKFEASLKCLDEGIAEWSPQLQCRLDRCTLRTLGLPGGFVGAVAELSQP
jgi:hypothetical protein